MDADERDLNALDAVILRQRRLSATLARFGPNSDSTSTQLIVTHLPQWADQLEDFRRWLDEEYPGWRQRLGS